MVEKQKEVNNEVGSSIKRKFYVKIIEQFTESCRYGSKTKTKVFSSFNIDHKDIKEIETFLTNSDIKESMGSPKKAVRCIETNMIFETKAKAGIWLKNQNLVKDFWNAEQSIRAVCNGRRTKAYGYHWEYVEA